MTKTYKFFDTNDKDNKILFSINLPDQSPLTKQLVFKRRNNYPSTNTLICLYKENTMEDHLYISCQEKLDKIKKGNYGKKRVPDLSLFLNTTFDTFRTPNFAYIKKLSSIDSSKRLFKLLLSEMDSRIYVIADFAMKGLCLGIKNGNLDEIRRSSYFEKFSSVCEITSYDGEELVSLKCLDLVSVREKIGKISVKKYNGVVSDEGEQPSDKRTMQELLKEIFVTEEHDVNGFNTENVFSD